MKTTEAARGKWRGILMTLGVDKAFLTGKHGPCPICGGRDRYRWDNREGSGSFFCSQCGSGDGMELLKRVKQLDFAAAAKEVDRVCGRVPAEQPRLAREPDDIRRSLTTLWQSARPIQPGDPVSLYLDRRGVPLPASPDVLRFHPSCPVPHEAGQRMAMLARVTGPDGKGATIHRTFLTPHGSKADMEQPRAVMPGSIPDGSAIRLAPIARKLGIAEGIETALAATKRFGIPVWSAINTTILSKWIAPEGVEEVVIFGDNDRKYGGAAAAYTLAHALAARRGLPVEVRIPGTVGTDWADAA